MSILNLQKRARELGRIRIGQTIDTGRKNKDGKPIFRPTKLDRFRLTSASKPLLERVAALYGGQVAEWTPPNGGTQQWEVITSAVRVPILVPPQPVSQWMELWSGSGCQRRCDQVTEVLSDQPCLCAAQDEQVCKPTTRLNVVLRDVEGIGVWRLESHGWSTASELPQVAEFLAHAGAYVEAWLGLEERSVKAEVDGEVSTHKFMVPTIEVDITPAALMAGGAGISGEALTSGPQPPRAAIEASGSGVPDYLAEAKAATTLDEWREVYTRASNSDPAVWTMQLKADLTAIGEQLKTAGPAEPASTSEDPDLIWQQILAVAGGMDPPMSLPDVEDDFAQRNGGVTAATASGAELAAYLEHLRDAA